MEDSLKQLKKSTSVRVSMEDVVCVGDLVCLYCEDSRGYLLNFTSSSVNHGISTFSGQDRDTPENITDPQGITFEILLKNRYKLQKKLRKHQRKQGSKRDEERVVLEKKAKSEDEENTVEQKRQRGARLRYGQVIQMKHQFTGRYVHSSTTQTSQKDKNYMACLDGQVELHPYNAKHAQFKILPRFKVKSEGDLVQFNDQIVLESVKSPFQFLHASSPANMDFVGAGNISSDGNKVQFCEVNLGVQKSGFTVVRYRKQDSAKLIKGGAVIRLYHKEQESYLVAQGYLNKVKQQCHLRIRHVDPSYPKTKFPPTSGVTYWQLEHLDSIVNGSPLRWEQRVLIRHLVTRHYIGVDDKGSLVLTKHRNHPDVVFRLHSVTRDTEDVEFGSYIRIQHALSGKWLHACEEEFQLTSTRSEEEISALSLGYDTAAKKVIQAETLCHYDDAFTLQEVSDVDLQNFNFIAGMMPSVLHLKQHIRDGSLRHLDVTRNRQILDELADYLLVDKEPHDDRQKLLRNLMIVDQLIRILRLGNVAKYGVKTICERIYYLLENYLKGNNRKNELYIARHMQTFTGQINKQTSVGEPALAMIIELVRDNRHIVDALTMGRNKETQLLQYVKLLETSKDFRYLEMLSVFCVCDGFTLSENQTYITQHWLEKSQNCVYLTEMGGRINKDPTVLYLSTDSGKTWTSLHHYCSGRNNYAIDVITNQRGYLTWEEALHCLQDKKLPNALRAVYCELIIKLFVDVGSTKSVVDQMTLSLDYNHVLPETGRKSRASKMGLVKIEASSSSAVMSTLKSWIADFLQENCNMTAELEGTNKLIEQVLQLVHYLIRFGQYMDTEDIQKLRNPLLRLLDGRNDKQFTDENMKRSGNPYKLLDEYKESGRFVASPTTKVMVDTKYRAMEVVELLLTFQFNQRLERFVGLFKHQSEKMDKHSENSLAALMEDNCNPLVHTDLKKKSRKAIVKIVEEVCLFELDKITDILLDLCDYQYNKMITKSIQLLIKFYLQIEDLFSKAVQATVLVTQESCRVYEYVKQNINTLKRLSTAKLNADQSRELCQIVDKLASFCSLTDDPEEIHDINQVILANFGIHQIVRELLGQGVGRAALEQPNLRSVMISALGLLRVLVKGNPTMQKFTFEFCEEILRIQGVETQAANTLIEVFTGHMENCLTISPHLILRIVELAAVCTEEAPEFLDLLCAIVKIEELNEPLKRNQDFVMKYVMQNYGKIGYLFDSDKKERDLILKGENGPQHLSYLISLVDLMANCAEGENRFIESLCQTLLPMDDITDILNKADLDNNLKRPYLRLLLWAHVNTATGMSDTAKDLTQNLTGYLRSLSMEAKKLTEYIKTHPDITVRLLKKQPSKSAVSISPQDQAFGTLHYFLDAVLPFVSIFFTAINLDEAPTQFRSTAADLAAKLFMESILVRQSEGLGSDEDFAQIVAPLICNKHQLAAVSAGLGGMVKLVESPEQYEGILRQVKRSSNSMMPVVNQSRQRYMTEYNQEIELNRKLNVFAENFRKAYNGVNTVADQLGHPSTAVYTEEGQDEDLPLGPEFQSLVKCFTPNNYKQTAKLLEQLYISCTSSSTQDKENTTQVAVDVKCLQILRALIHNECCKVPTASTKDSDYEQVVHIQNVLINYDAVNKTMALLQRKDSSIVREYFAFVNMLLLRINVKAQAAFRACFTGTREEAFFFAVKERIQMSVLYTKEKRVLAAHHEAKQQREKALQKTLRETMSARDVGETKAKKEMPPNWKENALDGISDVSVEPSVPARYPILGKKASKLSYLNHLMDAACDNPNALNNNDKEKLGDSGVTADSTPIQTTDPDKELGLVDFKDQGYIELMLRMMARMCDGQFTELQDYLREQPDNYKSANIVTDTTNFLGLLYSNIQPTNIDLVTQIFVTLNEFASGNLENHFVIFDHHIAEYINYILRGSLKNVTIRKKLDLWSAIGCLLMSMMEEIRPETSRLLQELSTILDKEGISRVAVECRQMPPLTEEHAGCEDVGFQYFFLLMKLKDLGAEVSDYMLPTPETLPEFAVFQFYRDNHMSIEILRANHIQVVRFRLRDKKVLREEVKEKLKWNIDRSSPTNKLRELMEWSKDILEDITYQKKIQTFPPLRFFSNLWELWNNVAVLLSLIICIIMLVAWDAKTSLADLGSVGEALLGDNSTLYNPVPDYPDWFPLCLRILGIIHLCVSVVILLIFFITSRPRFHPIRTFRKWFRQSTLLGLKSATKKFEKQHKSELRVELLSFRTFYHVAFVVFSVLGLLYHGYFFAFHLLNIVYNNQVLKRVILAVTLNGKSLIWVGLLGLIVIFQFSLVAFAKFRYAMDPNGDEATLYCGDLWECTVTLIRFGLVGDLFEKMAVYESERSFRNFGVLAVYHIAFFILITTVGLNIVFGIILDTFSELRHAKFIAEQDMKEHCFICSKPAHLFESNAKGFNYHVKNEHNLWAYIFFFIHLNDTDKGDLTHLELYVDELKKQSRYNYFPMNRALGLSQDKDWKAEKLDEILDKVRTVIERSEKEDSQRRRDQERKRQERWEREHRQNSRDSPLLVGDYEDMDFLKGFSP